MRQLIPGIVASLAFAVFVVAVTVFGGLLPSGADVKPPQVEEFAARTSLKAAISRQTQGLADPLTASNANLLAGLKAYGQNCAICHGASDASPSKLARGFYIAAPQLAKHGVENDPESHTFWKLKHGIRFTAMPAFGGSISDEGLWQITAFLKHMHALPQPVDAAWKALPSVGS